MNSEDKVRIHEEIFHLIYNSNGGFTHDEVYSMPVYLRHFNVNMLLNQKQREKEAEKSSGDHHSPTSKISPRNPLKKPR